MTDKELMQEVLEALQSSVPTQDGFLNHCKAMNHIRIRLAQPEQELVCVCGAIWEGQELVSTPPQRKPKQEPVAWAGVDFAVDCTPPRREWVGLTDDEIALICGECAASAHKTDDISYARAIEAKLKEKNT